MVERFLLGVLCPVTSVGGGVGVIFMKRLFEDSCFSVGDRVVVFLGELNSGGSASVFRVTNKSRKIVRLTDSSVGVGIDGVWRKFKNSGRKFHVYVESFVPEEVKT